MLRFVSRHAIAAIVIAGLCVTAGAEPSHRDLSRPLKVPPKLVVQGESPGRWLTAWDAQSIWLRSNDTSDQARAVAWVSLEPKGAFELGRKLIDRQNSDDWIWLGLTMLELGDESLAQRAFAPATRLDANLNEPVRRAMDLFDNGKDPRDAFADAKDAKNQDPATPAETGAGNPNLPQGSDSPHQWSKLSAQELKEHSSRMMARCAELQDLAGAKLLLNQTEHFLFYSDLSSGENQRWVKELDRMYQALLVTLDIPKGTHLFQGKCAVFVFRERSTFLDFERDAFGFDASRAGGLNHQINGDTFTVFHKGSNDQWFNSVLIHETVHAFMYRYRSSGRLPTWANEGLADYVAGHLVQYSTEPASSWQQTRNFVVKGGDPATIMQLNYQDGSWPSDDSYAVSHMLVRFMLKHKPRAFKLWIDNIKAGADWHDALEEHFNVTADRLARGFAADIINERGYSRLD